MKFVDFETITNEINEVNKKYKYDKYNNHAENLLITYTQYKDNEAFAGYLNNYTTRANFFAMLIEQKLIILEKFIFV